MLGAVSLSALEPGPGHDGDARGDLGVEAHHSALFIMAEIVLAMSSVMIMLYEYVGA